jgi:hypothetical protein
MPYEDVAILLGSGTSLARASVIALMETGEILVEVPGEPPEPLLCDFLVTSSAPLVELHPGDTVLVHRPGDEDERGCVLGRIGPYRRPDPASQAPPDRIVIEAQEELTLRCGGGTVALRGDGKVLIQGQDVVAHARRTHRIKGGSVAIN